MLDDKRVAVVIPAYNEEQLIGKTVGGIPYFVDRIYVVDDGSEDATAEQARASDGDRVRVLEHKENRGVGAAVVTGYKQAIDDEVDVTAVMNADAQMDPADLEKLVRVVASGDTDYAKANRLMIANSWEQMPRHRWLGNAILSFLTKIASGYWHVADSQSGYTAINLESLRMLNLDRIYPRYGFPNDLLVHLNVVNRRVRDIPSRPIYGVGERSDLRLRRVVPTISWLLIRRFFWRLKEKYVIRDFHPLVLFYALGMFLLLAGFVLGCVETGFRLSGEHIPAATAVLIALLFISGLQLTLFAMWFDMESNKDLR
ncbi:MAG: glycosyltransferase family 2 protein [Actinomycetota bacterium]|nr:glycosyltransferase family 2 protein [Actinomycetota bacterium]